MSCGALGKGVVLLALATTGVGGCGARLFERWDGRPVVTRQVPVPADRLWRPLVERAAALGLVIAEVRPEDRMIRFDWITAPGDGRLYLRCRAAGPIGSASLRPRLSVRPSRGGSVVVIESEVRATTTRACASTGQLEGWLLRQFEPVIAALAPDPPPVEPGGALSRPPPEPQRGAHRRSGFSILTSRCEECVPPPTRSPTSSRIS